MSHFLRNATVMRFALCVSHAARRTCRRAVGGGLPRSSVAYRSRHASHCAE